MIRFITFGLYYRGGLISTRAPALIISLTLRVGVLCVSYGGCEWTDVVVVGFMWVVIVGGLGCLQVKEVESFVQAVVSKALPVHTRLVPLAQGQAITSLHAVFGETYPDPVRVVAVEVGTCRRSWRWYM
jgi:hypothetical protein